MDDEGLPGKGEPIDHVFLDPPQAEPLDEVIEAIRDANIDEIGIVIGDTGAVIREAVGNGDRFGVMTAQPGIACLAHGNPRHAEEKREHDGQRREETCQLHTGTITIGSPRRKCKSVAAPSPAIETSIHPVDPTIVNGPVPE